MPRDRYSTARVSKRLTDETAAQQSRAVLYRSPNGACFDLGKNIVNSVLCRNTPEMLTKSQRPDSSWSRLSHVSPRLDNLLFGDQNQIRGGAERHIGIYRAQRAHRAFESGFGQVGDHGLGDSAARRAAFVGDQKPPAFFRVPPDGVEGQGIEP